MCIVVGMETTDTITATTFQVGETYDTGKGRDYVWTFRVTARTAKFLTIVEIVNGRDDNERRVKIAPFRTDAGNVESCLPLGRYSMAPVMTAARVA